MSFDHAEPDAECVVQDQVLPLPSSIAMVTGLTGYILRCPVG